VSSKKFKARVKRKPRFTDTASPTGRPAVLYETRPVGSPARAVPWAHGPGAGVRSIRFEGSGSIGLAPALRSGPQAAVSPPPATRPDVPPGPALARHSADKRSPMSRAYAMRAAISINRPVDALTAGPGTALGGPTAPIWVFGGPGGPKGPPATASASPGEAFRRR
jgi:hypothetical protein